MEVQNHLNNIKEKESQLEDAHGEIMTMKNSNSNNKDADDDAHIDKNQMIEGQQAEIVQTQGGINQPQILEQCEILESEIIELKQ